jgi:hypothetical protein
VAGGEKLRIWRRESAPCPHQIDTAGKKSNDVAAEIPGGGRRSCGITALRLCNRASELSRTVIETVSGVQEQGCRALKS